MPPIIPNERGACPAQSRHVAPAVAVTLQIAHSGYLEPMARPARPEPATVFLGLEVSGLDAARSDEVLARPEFTGWTREQWCYEIIQTAMRYYVGDRPGASPRQQPSLRQVPPPPPPPRHGARPPA